MSELPPCHRLSASASASSARDPVGLWGRRVRGSRGNAAQHSRHLGVQAGVRCEDPARHHVEGPALRVQDLPPRLRHDARRRRDVPRASKAQLVEPVQPSTGHTGHVASAAATHSHGPGEGGEGGDSAVRGVDRSLVALRADLRREDGLAKLGSPGYLNSVAVQRGAPALPGLEEFAHNGVVHDSQNRPLAHAQSDAHAHERKPVDKVRCAVHRIDHPRGLVRQHRHHARLARLLLADEPVVRKTLLDPAHDNALALLVGLGHQVRIRRLRLRSLLLRAPDGVENDRPCLARDPLRDLLARVQNLFRDRHGGGPLPEPGEAPARPRPLDARLAAPHFF
eukprot:CAMPEP_0196645476 /NCGR_PEP_ID=MMETSP1085-20130531/8583_2 /TAXON_ID=41879 ORGANISM="Pycnococcus sp, Strain CCMP1998" /NCGR_SAMPLE_ID=MMETSP1085 /ASSEMBLY_ACC=CAM_ASM_000807 /LENGTH=337 /DNA_ID=CAMNT_0041975079 /DNA_START=61 /DNA_END=1071 /DNA_ORIENTATION=-